MDFHKFQGMTIQAPDEEMVREHVPPGGFPADSVGQAITMIETITAE